MGAKAQDLTDKLPLLIRSGGAGGLTTAADHRQYEALVIEVIAFLEDMARGNRITSDALGGDVPTPEPDVLGGDLCVDLDTGNLWQWQDGEWLFRLCLVGAAGARILGGPGAPDDATGKFGDWYFQYGTAAWERTSSGWVNRFALGSGTAASWLDSGVGVLTNLLTTAKSSVVAAINELVAKIADNTSNIGSLNSLATTAKGNLVAAVNEVLGKANDNTTLLNKLLGGTTLDYAATVTLDFADPRRRYLTLTGDCTLAFSNLAVGGSMTIYLAADSTPRVVTLPDLIGYTANRFTNSSRQFSIAANSEWVLVFDAKGTTAAKVRVAAQPITF